MESLRHWLGRQNGETMLCEVLRDCTAREARCAVVTYCKIFNVKPDSDEWEELMGWIDADYNCWFENVKELDEYMKQDFDSER